jgi:deazaflavin-dependent oxidoreductase (nitroreductase family)
MRDRTAKQLSALHTLLYRATQGVLGRRLVKNDMLLLTTVGRRTNKPHTVPLLYLRDGGNLAVVASWGGRDNHPEWYLNLSAEPQVRVQVRSRRMEMAARIASPEERDRLWPQVLAAYDGYVNYQSRTDREIPIVILTAR